MCRLLRIALVCIDLGESFGKEGIDGVAGFGIVRDGHIRSIRLFLGHGAEGVVAVLPDRGILLGGKIVASNHYHAAGRTLVPDLSYTFIYIRAQEFLDLDVRIIGLVPLVGEPGDDAARADVESGVGITLVAPGAFAQLGHPAAEFLAGSAEPGIEVHHAVEFVEVEFLEIDVIVFYHCATVALKMSSMIFSMISAQRALSTASSELVES